jgi:O-antigen/teichoic acid export membrane protein
MFASGRIRQTAALYSSEILLMALTFATGILNSRFLGAAEYGIYAFVMTVVEVIMIFGGLGYPQAGARIMALTKDPSEERSVMGALVVVALLMGVGMSATLGGLIPIISSSFDAAPNALAMGLFLCVTAPMQLVLMQGCRGGNRIGVLASLKILPKGLYLVGGLCVVYFVRLTAVSSLTIYLIATVTTCVIAVLALRVRFSDIKSRIKTITGEVKRYGFHSYLGGIADNSTFKLNNLLIAGYVDTTWLGFYSIASTMVSPMANFSISLSTAAYKSLASRDRIDKRIFFLNAAFLLCCGGFVALCARALIHYVLTDQFLPATGLVYILIFTAFFQGMYQPINAFLGSHGRGKELRAISLWVSLVNLIVAVVLIPRIGAYGAALGSSIAKLCELIGNIYFYRRITAETQRVDAGSSQQPQIQTT